MGSKVGFKKDFKAAIIHMLKEYIHIQRVEK